MINIIKNRLTSIRKSFAKLLFDKKTKERKVLDLAAAKSVLFIRNDNKIGDMVALTFVFREIKKHYPGVRIIALCGKDNKEIIKNNKNVDEIIESGGNFLQNFALYKKLKEKKISITVDFFIFRPRAKHLLMLRMISPRFLIGFHKRNYNMYDLSIDCDINELHISKRYEILLNELGIKASFSGYELFLDKNDEEKAAALFENKGANLIINPLAASAHRSFSFDKLQDLINRLKAAAELNIFVICAEKSCGLFKNLQNASLIRSRSVLESAAYIKHCDYVISPDTSVVHIAAAFRKKMAALFLDYSRAREKIDKVWAPGYDDAVQIRVDASRSGRENDIKNIDNELIVKTFLTLAGKDK